MRKVKAFSMCALIVSGAVATNAETSVTVKTTANAKGAEAGDRPQSSFGS